MSNDLIKTLTELHGIVNNFTIRGDGVSGNLKDGYSVEFDPVSTQPMNTPEGPEGPELPQQ